MPILTNLNDFDVKVVPHNFSCRWLEIYYNLNNIIIQNSFHLMVVLFLEIQKYLHEDIFIMKNKKIRKVLGK